MRVCQCVRVRTVVKTRRGGRGGGRDGQSLEQRADSPPGRLTSSLILDQTGNSCFYSPFVLVSITFQNHSVMLLHANRVIFFFNILISFCKTKVVTMRISPDEYVIMVSEILFH